MLFSNFIIFSKKSVCVDKYHLTEYVFLFSSASSSILLKQDSDFQIKWSEFFDKFFIKKSALMISEPIEIWPIFKAT